MALSTMQEILILLEDEKKVPFYRLERWGRPARGVLSKLKNMGLAEKIKVGDEIYYEITQEGEKYIDDLLGFLKNKGAWDKKWRFVMFEIPETNRALRDKLRRELANLGLGILQASVWISSRDVKKEIDEISAQLELGSQLKFFEVSSNTNLDQQIIDKSWNVPELDSEVEEFIKKAEWALKAMGKGNGDRYNAKKLIFEYAQTIKKGPALPGEFVERHVNRLKARELYLKLRKHIG